MIFLAYLAVAPKTDAIGQLRAEHARTSFGRHCAASPAGLLWLVIRAPSKVTLASAADRIAGRTDAAPVPYAGALAAALSLAVPWRRSVCSQVSWQ